MKTFYQLYIAPFFRFERAMENTRRIFAMTKSQQQTIDEYGKKHLHEHMREAGMTELFLYCDHPCDAYLEGDYGNCKCYQHEHNTSMTESQQLALKVDEFLSQNEFICCILDGQTLRWCVKQIMSRNGLTQKEALEMIGIVEKK